LAFDQRLGFTQERVSNDPIKPTATEVAAVELRHLALCNFTAFGEGGAGLVCFQEFSFG
jgi:hypothetical protein